MTMDIWSGLESDSCRTIQGPLLAFHGRMYVQPASPSSFTKKGKPVAKLVPSDNQPDDIFACLKEKIVGDIESPVTPLEGWDALR